MRNVVFEHNHLLLELFSAWINSWACEDPSAGSSNVLVTEVFQRALLGFDFFQSYHVLFRSCSYYKGFVS